MAQYGYGVDVGGTSAKIGLFTAEGKLLEKWEVRTDTSDGGENILPNIAASVQENIRKHGFAKEDLLGIGMGLPGTATAQGTSTCVNLGWHDYPAVQTLESLTGLRVRIANDANAAALGEMWQGGGKGHDSIVMVTLGTGVGGGIIIGGKILVGAHGSAGEIGHIPVNPKETRPCGCGKYGCLEQYTSANGNARVAQDYLQETDEPSPLRTAERVNSKLCWDLAIQGDKVASAITDRFCDYLGMGLATVANTIDPEAIIIGGGVSKTGQPLIDWLRPFYQKYAFHTVRDIGLYLAALGNDAGMYGCVRMLLD